MAKYPWVVYPIVTVKVARYVENALIDRQFEKGSSLTEH